MDSDEALARFLQEQDKLEMEEMHKADLELARQLQKNLSQKDSPSLSKPINNNPYFLSDYALARKLEQEEKAAYASYISSDTDLARQLANTVDESILDEEIPNLHQLFMFFNKTYFNNKLDMIEVKWSTKMTRCAGTCTYTAAKQCIVTLSEPLLKFRPKKDMIETLLHEMIHALLFVTRNNTDREGHGPEFLREAKRISDAANVNITVFHDFHSEVQHYQTHVWKCNGTCQYKPPYYGLVKRSMNRPPQPADIWYEEHQRNCGGTYTKISSPPSKRKSTNTLDNYFSQPDETTKKRK